MTTITLKIKHSDAWVKAQRIARGENVPDEVIVTVPPADMSLAVREILLACADRADEEAKAALVAKLAAARQLLAGELLAGEKAKAKLWRLSEFVAEIPTPILRATVARLAADKADDYEKQIEDCSPVVLFGAEDDDDSCE